MAKAGAIRQGRAFVELFTDDSKLVQGLRQAERTVNRWGRNLSRTSASLAKVGASILAPLAGAVAMFKKQGDALADMSVRTGFAVETLSALEYVGSQTAVTMDQLQTAIRMSQKAIGDPTLSRSLSQIGLEAEHLRQLSPEDQFFAMADHIKGINDQSLKAATAMRLFGRQGVQLVEMLNLGSDGLHEMMREAERLGIVMSTDAAKAADQFDNVIGTLNLQIKRLVGEVGAALVPVLEEVIQKISKIIPKIKETVAANAGLIVMVAKIGAGFIAASVAVKIAAVAMTTLVKSIAILRGIITTLNVVAKAMMNPWVAIPVVIVGAVLVATGALKEIEKVFRQTFRGMSDALSAGDLKLAGQILWTSLKILWREGSGYLGDIWDSLMGGMAKVVDGFAWGISETFHSTIKAIQVGFYRMIEGVSGAFADMSAWLASQWTKLKGKFDSTIDVTAELNRIERERQEKANAPSKADKYMDEWAKGIDARKALRDAMWAESDRQMVASMEKRAAKIQELRDKLDDLTGQARAAKEAQKDFALGAIGTKGFLGGFETQARMEARVGFEVGRSFGWGAAGVREDRGLQIAEESKNLLSRIERNTADGQVLAWSD